MEITYPQSKQDLINRQAALGTTVLFTTAFAIVAGVAFAKDEKINVAPAHATGNQKGMEKAAIALTGGIAAKACDNPKIVHMRILCAFVVGVLASRLIPQT